MLQLAQPITSHLVFSSTNHTSWCNYLETMLWQYHKYHTRFNIQGIQIPYLDSDATYSINIMTEVLINIMA